VALGEVQARGGVEGRRTAAAFAQQASQQRVDRDHLDARRAAIDWVPQQAVGVQHAQRPVAAARDRGVGRDHGDYPGLEGHVPAPMREPGPRIGRPVEAPEGTLGRDPPPGGQAHPTGIQDFDAMRRHGREDSREPLTYSEVPRAARRSGDPDRPPHQTPRNGEMAAQAAASALIHPSAAISRGELRNDDRQYG